VRGGVLSTRPARVNRRRERVQGTRKEDVFFFEKKNQKTFVCLAPRQRPEATSRGESARAKVFWFFF
jgi:hypothetical protein